MKKCLDCKWWGYDNDDDWRERARSIVADKERDEWDEDATIGEMPCRRHAPVVITTGDSAKGMSGSTVFPHSSHRCYCGDFEEVNGL